MARFAFALALALTLGAHAVSAQDSVRVDTAHVTPAHVLPPDSAGFLSRTMAELFRRSLPSTQLQPAQRVAWDLLPSSGGIAAAFQSRVARSRADDEAEALRQHLFKILGTRTAEAAPEVRRGLLGISSKTAEVTFEGSLQFTINTTRTRNLACTALQVQDVASGCSGGFKGPNISNLVLLTTRGVFAERYHLNIDFDTQRDYSAGQIVSIYYQGLVDEKLKRVDVGTVQWQPPASRFFTATIPSNNFGISAEADFGPFNVRAILATQKGSVVNTKTYTIGSGVVAPQDITTRDLDYEARRVFWVVNPRTLPAYPAVDILNAGPINIAADSAPADVRIYRYVAINQGSGANANYDGITASATNGTESVGALRWRLLKRNIDYWIDPSGLWFTLNNAISPNDYLAVSYTTKSGGTVGTVPVTDDSTRHDQLRLIYLPNRSPASPLFFYEMRQVYRVAGSSLVRSSLRGQLLVSGSERPDGAAGTFLSLLGMALSSEEGTLDVENRVFPRTRDPGAGQLIKDALLVFPNAQPFSDPRLTARERNDSMYVTPEYLLSTQGPPSVFQLHLLFDAQGGTDRSGLALDGIQITEGSERLEMNGRRLVKDVDYGIDYTTGRVTFLNPNELFGNGQATVTASFEQRGLFAIAPTSIAGITTTWRLGINKSVSISALYQAEATGYTRPQIGYEARASFLAGLTTDLTFNAPWLTNLTNKLVTKRTSAQSSIRITGEVAMSRPDPNRSGDAYLEQFEDDNSIRVVASQNRWIPGSVPKAANGLLDILPRGFDSTEAVQLIWQNLVPNARDTILQYSPHDIDATIALTQSTSPTIEPVLWTTLHADTAGGIVDHDNRAHWSQPSLDGHPRWRTMTTALSPTGVDLSRNDYFEFALYQTRDTIIKQTGMRMVIDIGKVSEDALAIAPTNFHIAQAGEKRFTPGDTVFTGRQYVGVGRLDTEKNYFGAWNALSDDFGILGDRPDTLKGPNAVLLVRHPLCAENIGAQISLYPFGDLGARCSVANGAADSEDLDGDNILDAQGPSDDVFRYVIDFAKDAAKYVARQTLVFPDASRLDTLHAATWTIYRIPLRDAQDTIGNPDIHLIKQMRMAFVAPAANDGSHKPVFFALALMRFSGAAWVSRAARPISTLSGARAEPHGTVQVGTISTQDGDSTGRGYTSPPGIGNAASTLAVSSSQFSQQINEKALSIIATDLHAGERAEGYLHLSGGSQNLLAYSQLRVWMHGGARINQAPAAGWEDGRLRAYLKIGSDAYNFYLYNAPARTTSWDPEMIVDLQVWQDLRQQIENARLHDPDHPRDLSGCSSKGAGLKGDSTAWIACSDDGAYFVQIRDPQINPPNLSAVQELGAGIYYLPGTGAGIAKTELWVDDIRVGLPVSRVGYVAALSAQARVADLASFDLSGVYQDGNFHQLGQAPTYQNIGTLSAVSVLHVEKLLPTRWGLIIPAVVSSNWGWTDPQLINGTDVQANGIDGLRRPRVDATQWRFTVSHPNRANEAMLSRLVLSPLSLTASGSTGTNISALSDASSSAWSTTLSYTLSNRRRTHPVHLGWLTRGLPTWFQESTAGKGIANASYAPIPTLIQFASAVSHTMGDLQTYQVPITRLADTILKPVTSEQFLWRNQAGMNWEPLGILTFTSNWASTRDLRHYPDSTSIARVANAGHASLLGTDVGVERDRNLRNTLLFAPRFASWLSTSASISSNFFLSRSLTSRNPVRIDGDTAGAYILPQTLNDSRQTLYRVTVDPRRLAQRIWGDSSAVSKALVQVQPIVFSREYTLQSTFDLARFDPSLGYQLALGGLDAFLNRSGQRAIDATDGVTTTMAATVDLPSGLSAQLNYSQTASDRYQQASGNGFLKSSGVTTSWPSGRVAWSQTFQGGPILLVNASTSIQRDQATSTSPFSDGTGAVATSETRRWSPDLNVRFRNNVGVRLTGQFDNTNASYGGNLTQTGSTTMTGNVAWSVRMPHFLSATRRTLATNISLSQTGSNSCIQHTGDATCASYYDFQRREAHTGFTAFLAHGIHAGFDFGYIHNEVRSLKQVTATISLSALLSVPLNPGSM